MLTDRGSEYRGSREHHEYVLYLSIEDVEHSFTKAYHPQTNGICKRFHKTIQGKFYNIAFRTKMYKTLEELQGDFDEWLHKYNVERTHQGKHCFGQTPMECFVREKHRAQEKMIGFENIPNQEQIAAASTTRAATFNLEKVKV